MDSNVSTAAYMHRPPGSSNASIAGTASSLGNAGLASGGRVAVIGVTRNVRLRRRGASGFGFSLRGGREYAAGFYVSDVQPGGEAHRNGLRIGDQILRVNGYPVEDAVHQEVALLAKNQQILVLKIRSVGMIPVKDNPNDPVTWHMVQQQQQQFQYNETGSGSVPSCTEVRIRITVGEKGRLGCGVCRGIVPGLTVQGTREGGPARAAGLKAGDVIIWCNGQRLTDLPFERAIEVMRGAAVLDLVVNRPAPNHLYDCPETLWMRGSSGYNSESSSLIAESPPHSGRNAPSSPQRLGEIGTGPRRGHDEPCGNGRICCPLALSTSSCTTSEWSHVDQMQEWTRKSNNTTVIQVNQNQSPYQRSGCSHGFHPGIRGENYEKENEPLYDPVAPRADYEVHDFDTNSRHDVRNVEPQRRQVYQRDNCDVIYDGPADDNIGYYTSKVNNGQPDGNRLAELQLIQSRTETERKTVTTVEVHSVCPPVPPSMPPPLSYKWQADTKPMNAMGMQMGSTMSMGSTGSTETESSLESSCSKDSASTSSSLSTSSCDPASTVSFASNGGANTGTTNKPNEQAPGRIGRICASRTSPSASIDLGSAITQELQRRAQQRLLNAAKSEQGKENVAEPRKVQNPEALRVQEQKVTHDKLMEEFKRAHRKMFSGAQQHVQFSDQADEQEQEKRQVNGSTSCPPPPPLPSSAKGKIGEDAVEMQSLESFKLKESPSTVPKPPPTYFSPATSTSVVEKAPPAGSPRHGSPGIPKDANPQDLPSTMESKKSPPAPPPISANSQPLGKEVTTKPVVAENVISIAASNSDTAKPVSLVQRNVEKLSAALNNKVTIKVSPEQNGR
ncbi:uncharacterized protein LOC105704265 isoform X2 [Orussus abietinus]|uniref:uncharacterized protein LOC105704265 isoform X2 n=1 Tax=Orussus abietinus TaxID=222816 RepID=UPI000C716004|nr:uncharacterized protein LOC105704265 isoform X2 [Orussus abietinus]